MSFDDATRAQVEAADPAGSTWLTANAGSGKTRVLTNRVAWLLLNGARPERILCLTFTKAAASEMQNRLFARLGEWAMLEDAALAQKLGEMGVPEADRQGRKLAQARTLFARAIEAPGGLKIQTIHAFAAGILRRFPLEAGVSPGFTEIEERAQVILMDEVLDAMADGPEAGLISDLAAYASGGDLRGLMAAVLDKRDGFLRPLEDLRDWLGLAQRDTAEALLAQVFHGDEAELCARVAGLLDPETRGNPALIQRLMSFPCEAPDLAKMGDLEHAFLFGEKTKNPFAAKIGKFANKAVRDALGEDLGALEAFMLRIEEARETRLALQTYARAEVLHRFARAFIPAYDAAKEARGWLDFGDLIRHARGLLTDPEVAPWVLYRLDGGIDHLLVDEAQDTSPEQWDIVAALAEEFAAGQGAREDVARTLFVVGDVKQSIYSFQGADPEGFARMRAHFAERLAESAAPLASRDLVYSFRSAPAILALVDAVAAQDGMTGVGADVRHAAFQQSLPGRVDLWPVIEASEEAEQETPWYDPIDLQGPTKPEVLMAERVADFMAEVLANPPMIRDDGAERPLDAGDILVLVRRRKGFFTRLIKEIKARDLPILGADRFEVTEDLSVKDLMAMLRVLATPGDDLSLATVLRSPLFGLSDDALFRLAHGRKGRLWSALEGQPSEVLKDLRQKAGSLRPYELLERALTHHGMRARLVARLGAEAEDGIDALLSQALTYERTEVPSLTGFIAWLEADSLSMKRDASQAKGQIRVMTVHGAKGLEAPLVILPETHHLRPGGGTRLLIPDDGVAPVWPGARSDAPDPVRGLLAQEAEKAAEERDRLLYVAMTRAAQWLVVGAWGTVATKDGPHSWYSAVETAMQARGALSVDTTRGMELRLQSEGWAWAVAAATPAEAQVELPEWTAERAPSAEAPRVRVPSDLGGAKVVPGDPGADDESEALRRGRLIHLLLEHLPGIDPVNWMDAAPGILALDGPEVPNGEAFEVLLQEAKAVLQAHDLKELFFDSEALAEVSLTTDSPVLGQRLLGQVDRLIIGPDHVLAIDFKTNQRVPETAAEVPEGLLRQMGAYAEMLGQIYPDKRVETAILWTKTQQLTALPHDAVMAALARAAHP